MNRKIIFIIAAIVILISLIFFIKTDYKIFNCGNNMSNKSLEEFEKYILNIESYQLVAEITVTSNKNINKYIVKQQYIKEDKIYRQEFIEPENICGLTFTYNNLDLKIEGANPELTKVYQKYPHITENNLGLSSFIEDYINSAESKCYSEKGQIILETKQKNGNKYTYSKKLYIDRISGDPTKMEIQDITQKILINILYNEVEINELRKEDVLAFKLTEVESEI